MPRHTLTSPDVDKPQGKYTIQLGDDRGKVKEVIKTNYITPLWEQFAKYIPCMIPLMWRFPHGSGGTSLYDGSQVSTMYPGKIVRPHHMRPFPWFGPVLTDSPEAEDANSHWVKGNTIAWASLYKTTIPASGKRGQINEAECTHSDDGRTFKWVWDWSTQQGNGEYQTLAMSGFRPTNGAIPSSVGPYTILGLSTTAVTGTFVDHLIAGGRYFMVMQTGTSARQLWQAPLPVDLFTTDYEGNGLVFDATTMTMTQVGGTNPGGMTGGQSGNANLYSGSSGFEFDEATDLIYFIEKGCGSTSGGKIGAMNLSGTAQWSGNPFGTGGWTVYTPTLLNGFTDVDLARVGTKLYCVCRNSTGGNNTKVLRFSTSGSTDPEASFILPKSLEVVGGITTDGTDLFIVCKTGLCRITTSGAFVENYGLPTGTGANIASGSLTDTIAKDDLVSPWSTGHSNSGDVFGGQDLPIIGMSVYDEGGSNEYMRMTDQTEAVMVHQYYPNYLANNDQTWPSHPTYLNNRLWIKFTTSPGGRRAYGGFSGANCLSRTLLDAPVTKSSSQTMKVSYELTLPDIWSLVHDHPAIV